MGHLGVEIDEARAASIPEEKRCLKCDGTGNQLYFMYQKCEQCNGTGIKAPTYLERWKDHADALHKVWSDYAQKIYDIDKSWAVSAPEMDDVIKHMKSAVVTERNAKLDELRKAYVNRENGFIGGV